MKKLINIAKEHEYKKYNFAKPLEEIENILLYRNCPYDYLLVDNRLDIDSDFCTEEECDECNFQKTFHNKLDNKIKCWNKEVEL